MELPFEKTVCRFWQQKQYTPIVQEETQEFRLPESLPDVGRVIAAWGQTVIRSREWKTGHLAVHGGVMVWVLYAPEDGSEVRRLESWLPFSVRLEQEGTEGVLRTESVLCSADARSISSRKLMLRCQVGLLVQTLVSRQAELMEPKDLPGDVEVLQQSYPMVLTRETGEKTFLMDETVTLPGGGAEKLIYYHICPRLLEQKVLGSKAVFRGVGGLHLLVQEKDGKLRGVDMEVPFAQYLDLDGTYDEGTELSNLLCVSSLEVELTEGAEVRVRCGLVSQYIINAPTVIRCMEDAYSNCRELELQRQEVLLPGWLEERMQEVELMERLEGEEVPVDAIFFPDLPRVTKQPGGVEVSVGGTFQTLCAGADGLLLSKSRKAGHTQTLATECDTVPRSWKLGPAAARREGSGWGLEAKLGLSIASLCVRPLSMVCGITAGETSQPKAERPSVIIRARRGEETLWDIAKYCGSTVSAIQRMNKLEAEPEENRLLLIPVV